MRLVFKIAALSLLMLFLTPFGGVAAWPEDIAVSKTGAQAGKSEEKFSDKAAIAYETARRTMNLQTEYPTWSSSPRKIRSSAINFPEGLAKIILIIAASVVLGVIGLAVVDYLQGRRPRFKNPEIAEESEDQLVEAAARMSQARDSADDLAQAGDFTQAMHLLLLQSVAELRRRLDVSIASCLTSREILARMKLSPEAKRSFADIIARVEVSYFGHYLPKLEDYLACRNSFERLKENIKARASA